MAVAVVVVVAEIRGRWLIKHVHRLAVCRVLLTAVEVVVLGVEVEVGRLLLRLGAAARPDAEKGAENRLAVVVGRLRVGRHWQRRCDALVHASVSAAAGATAAAAALEGMMGR